MTVASLQRSIADPRGPSYVIYEASIPQKTSSSKSSNKKRGNYNNASLGDAIASSAAQAHDAGKAFAIVRDATSHVWSLPAMVRLAGRPDVFSVIVDSCTFDAKRGRNRSAPSVRFRITTNDISLSRLRNRCDGADRCAHHTPPHQPQHGAPHIERLATPWCQALADAARAPAPTLFEGASWAETIKLQVHKGRHRDHGAPIAEVSGAAHHKRRKSVRQSVASGVQNRRVAYPPIFDKELHPGEAVVHACTIPFPFDAELGLDPSTIAAMDYVAVKGKAIINERATAVKHWTRRANELRQTSLDILDGLPLSHRKILLRGRRIGEFFHVALFKEMLTTINYPDTKYADEIIKGLRVTGPVAKSDVWLPEPDPVKRQQQHSIDYVVDRAWEYRIKVANMSLNEHSEQIRQDPTRTRLLGVCYDTPGIVAWSHYSASPSRMTIVIIRGQ